MTRQTIEVIENLTHRWQAVHQQLKVSDILDRAIDVQQIPAPTFEEHQRAAYIHQQFKAIGLQEVKVDDGLQNVYGWLNPEHREQQPVIVMSAHLDTVFPHNTDLNIRREETRVYGPGLGDNSLGVASLLMLAEILVQQADTLPDSPVCFVANSREEGLGNLDGIRAVLDVLPPERIGAAIVIEGMALGRVYHGGIAVRRLKISCHAEGGHSWLHFGRPSAIHSLMRLGTQISDLNVPKEPRTTYNIGLIEGGQSVNSIAAEAAFYLDLRSTETGALHNLERAIQRLVKQQASNGIRFKTELVGERPAGSIPADHPLVKLALAAQLQIGVEATLESGSTDANVLLASKVPAIVVGITHGGNAHRLDEFIETGPLREGMWQLILLAGGAMHMGIED
jgi:acetylornithine deacetylase/succinyl-diaminopimelate desuccinylase-like protein